MLNRRRIEQIFGETMREIGILVFVFAPLDTLFAEPRIGVVGVMAIALLAVAMMIAGRIVEGGQ